MRQTTPFWYRKLFDGLAKNSEQPIYREGTSQEVDFILEVLKLPKTAAILDVGCGNGRHSVELAKRGFSVTGLDYSKLMLTRAKKYAMSENVNVRFVHGDARRKIFTEAFDAAISICEGAFGLMENDNENIKILNSIFCALKKKGKLVLNVLSASFAHRHPEQDTEFDPKTSYGYWLEQLTDDNGATLELVCSNRYFTFPEIKRILEAVGFRVINGFGCLAGEFRRKEIELDDFEMLVVAQKL